MGINVTALSLVGVKPMIARKDQRVTVRLAQTRVMGRELEKEPEKPKRREVPKRSPVVKKKPEVTQTPTAPARAKEEIQGILGAGTPNEQGLEEGWSGEGEGLSGSGEAREGQVLAAPAEQNSPPPSQEEIQKALSDYRALLYALIEKNKEYPSVGRRLGHEGKVTVSFNLARSGNLISARIDESSGYSELDDSALSAVKKASPFPPFPELVSGESRSFSVRIVFELN